MKSIVKGNDFTMRIPVRKVVNGEKVKFPLPACTDIAVRLVTAYRRVPLQWTVDAADDSVLLARVEGDAISLGCYALEVKGKLFGNDWRSNEYEQLRIVDNNAEADTVPDGTDEGEDSVLMDTAVVIQTALRDAPLATADTAGVVMVGAGLTRDEAGRLNADVTGEVLHGYVEGREACIKGPGHNAVTTAGCRESHGGDATKGATGQWSMAEGCMTEAPGDHAHAEGYQCVASQTDAHAEGYHSVASGAGAHAEGKETEASGGFSHAEGTFTKATQPNAHAEGTKSSAHAEGAHAEGTSRASGIFSHSENNGTATGAFSHAEGRSQATGECSHAEGDGCMTYMPAGGGNTPKTDGTFCHVEGIGTICCSKGGHAEGNGSVTAGDFAHTEGISTRADGAGAHAEGKGTMVSCDGGHAEGCYNVSHRQFVHMVGVGTESARKNAEFTYYAPTGQTGDRNGYKYMIGVGGYDGVKTDVTQIKSVQEVLADLTASTGKNAEALAAKADLVDGKVPLAQLGNIDTQLFVVVTALPATGIKENKLYLVKNTESTEEDNVYAEYLHVGGKWEKMGDFRPAVDLSGYVKSTELVAYTDEEIDKMLNS